MKLNVSEKGVSEKYGEAVLFLTVLIVIVHMLTFFFNKFMISIFTKLS